MVQFRRRLQPNNPDLGIWLGAMHTARGKSEDAVKAYREGVAA